MTSTQTKKNRRRRGLRPNGPKRISFDSKSGLFEVHFPTDLTPQERYKLENESDKERIKRVEDVLTSPLRWNQKKNHHCLCQDVQIFISPIPLPDMLFGYQGMFINSFTLKGSFNETVETNEWTLKVMRLKDKDKDEDKYSSYGEIQNKKMEKETLTDEVFESQEASGMKDVGTDPVSPEEITQNLVSDENERLKKEILTLQSEVNYLNAKLNTLLHFVSQNPGFGNYNEKAQSHSDKTHANSQGPDDILREFPPENKIFNSSMQAKLLDEKDEQKQSLGREEQENKTQMEEESENKEISIEKHKMSRELVPTFSIRKSFDQIFEKGLWQNPIKQLKTLFGLMKEKSLTTNPPLEGPKQF